MPASDASGVLERRGAEWLQAMLRIRLFEEALAELYRLIGQYAKSEPLQNAEQTFQ